MCQNLQIESFTAADLVAISEQKGFTAWLEHLTCSLMVLSVQTKAQLWQASAILAGQQISLITKT